MSNSALFPPRAVFPRKKGPFRFALFAPEQGRNVDAFIHSFDQYLSNQCRVKHTIDTYYLADKDSLADVMSTQPYDLMVSLDSDCTAVAKEMVARIAPDMPLIFSCVCYHPDEQDALINRITGISTPMDQYATQMALVLSYTPTIKKILLIQDERDGCMHEVSDGLHKQLATGDYQLTTMPYSPTISRQNTVDIARHDMVILVGLHLDPEYIQRLSVLCQEHKTVLYISDASSVSQGAAFGFGKDDTSMGLQAAYVAHQIVTSEIVPEATTIPYRLKINLKALDAQGLHLIKLAPLLSLVNNTHVLTPTTQDKVAAYLRLEQIPLE